MADTIQPTTTKTTPTKMRPDSETERSRLHSTSSNPRARKDLARMPTSAPKPTGHDDREKASASPSLRVLLQTQKAANLRGRKIGELHDGGTAQESFCRFFTRGERNPPNKPSQAPPLPGFSALPRQLDPIQRPALLVIAHASLVPIPPAKDCL